MIWIDYIILAIIACSILVSLTRGLIKEVLSLVIWGLALFIAYSYYNVLSNWLTIAGLKNILLRNGVAITSLFISTLTIGAIASSFMECLVSKTGLTGTDQVLGMCFGGLRGMIIASLILFFLETFTDCNAVPDWQKSQLAPKCICLMHWILNYLKGISISIPR
ncbi:Colicin V production protein [Candidatus Erwinia haradaeae]|uniref:Colicin V production protein n=1 Tax=Candidatus Erwinia haradaeae TaxID=1922217 RepID=A0A451DJC4_9GAMM|nr:CvpA family protein [Candidatus Erwinia haradaeae]VFP86802.1 Colicin V production protein [Candidatus Erwinia haradaeae]